jgi:zinc protease
MRLSMHERHLSAIACVGILAVGTGLSAEAGLPRDIEEIRSTIVPLRAFTPQKPRQVRLANGLFILLQEDHELPLVSGSALIRGGSRSEPSDKVGLVEVFGRAWRTGGSAAHSGDALDDFLEARAAKIETSGGMASTSVSFRCLAETLDEVFPLFVELLRSAPAFPQEKVDLARRQLHTGIARRNDDPWEIAAREARKLAYGTSSPYARVSEHATVAAVTRADLSAWHREYVHPNNIVLSIAGDFDASRMEARLRKAFGDWRRGKVATIPRIELPPPHPGVYLVEKNDVKQTNIRIVHLGITRDNPDYYAAEVMNEIFGGASASRLNVNVRTKKGLAYTVGGGLGAGFDYPGMFTVGMATKTEGTAAGIDALFAEIDALQASPATAEELVRARESLLNSFIFRIDSKAAILREQAVYAFYGYPLDSLERYQAAISAVTVDDIARVARKHIHKERLAILVVGKADDFDRPLAAFGPLTTLDITIPALAPPAEAKP